MNLNVEGNPECEQAGSTGADLQYLESVFGPALVPLREDLGRLGIAVEPEALTESTPAGALCGASAGLLALVFSGEEAAKQLLTSNPVLASTLVTCQGDAHAVWLKPSNQLPRNTILDGIQIVTEGALVVYHPDPRMRCYIYQRGIPLAVDLGTLIFTGRLKEFVIDWTVRELQGPPTVPAGPRRRKLNVNYWGVWISKTMGIQFDVSRGLFVAPAPGTHEEIVIPAAKIPCVMAAMLQHARQARANVPGHELTPRRITEIVAALKMFCSISSPAEPEVLAEFVTTRLERRPGSILAKNAATVALLEFRRCRGLQPPANENILRRDLRLAIRKHLSVHERHDAGRWFKGLALRSTVSEQDAQHPLPVAGAVLGGKTEPQRPEATAESSQCTSNPT